MKQKLHWTQSYYTEYVDQRRDKKLDESFLILNGQYEKFKFTIEQKKNSCYFRRKKIPQLMK